MQLKVSQQQQQQVAANSSSGGDALHVCPFCNYSSVSDVRIKAHVQTQHMQHAHTPPPAPRTLSACPLCQEKFAEKPTLENHLMQVHNVSREGLQKLLLLVEPVPESPPPAPAPAPAYAPASPSQDDGDPMAEMLETQALKMAEEGRQTTFSHISLIQRKNCF